MSGFNMNVRRGCVGGTLNVCMGAGAGAGTGTDLGAVAIAWAFTFMGACGAACGACDCFGKNDWAGGAFAGVIG